MSRNKLQYYLERFKDLNNINNRDSPIKNITISSGLVLDTCIIGNMFEYRHYKPYVKTKPTDNVSYIVDVYIDDLLIWRKSKPFNTTKDSKIYIEDNLTNYILDEMIYHGISSSWKLIKDRKL